MALGSSSRPTTAGELALDLPVPVVFGIVMGSAATLPIRFQEIEFTV
jgi:hypothetical protein